jgi:hypothetical protein
MRGTHLFDRILNHFPPLKNTREVTLQLKAERMATCLTLAASEISCRLAASSFSSVIVRYDVFEVCFPHARDCFRKRKRGIHRGFSMKPLRSGVAGITFRKPRTALGDRLTGWKRRERMRIACPQGATGPTRPTPCHRRRRPSLHAQTPRKRRIFLAPCRTPVLRVLREIARGAAPL